VQPPLQATHSPTLGGRPGGRRRREEPWRCRRVWRLVALVRSRRRTVSIRQAVGCWIKSQGTMCGVLLCSSATLSVWITGLKRALLIRSRPSSSRHVVQRTTRPRATVVRPNRVAVRRNPHTTPPWSLGDASFRFLLLFCTPPSRCATRYVWRYFLVAAIALPPGHPPLRSPSSPLPALPSLPQRYDELLVHRNYQLRLAAWRGVHPRVAPRRPPRCG